MLRRYALMLHAWSASSFHQLRSGARLHRSGLGAPQRRGSFHQLGSGAQLRRSSLGAPQRRGPGLCAARDDEPLADASVAAAPPGVVDEALAGLSVAFSLLPKAIACASIVGVDPLDGVWSSVAMGVAAPAVGMRPGVIAGAAAVVVVPLGAFVAERGPELLPVVVVLAAALELAVGALRLTRLFLDLVSEPVLAGFLNALGLLLLASQAKVFETPEAAGVALLCAAIAQFLPRDSLLPPALVGLGVASVAGPALGLELPTLASAAPPGAFAGGLDALPRFGVDAALFAPANVAVALPTAMAVAFIALLETLLAARLVDDLKCEDLCAAFYDGETVDGFAAPATDAPTRSALALAAGNAASALSGGFGGCGLIPQTVLNLNSGGGGDLSSLCYAAALASFVVAGGPVVGEISQAAIAGVVVQISLTTIRWRASYDYLAAAARGGDAGPATALVVTCVSCYAGGFAAGVAAGVACDRVLLPALVNFDD